MLTRFKKITDYSPLTWYNKEAKETEPDNKSLIGGNPIIKSPPTHPNQLSVISYQLSVISYQLSVISYQLSVIILTPHTPHPTPKTHYEMPQMPIIGNLQKKPRKYDYLLR
jgi:hypothetical protein